MLAKVVVGPDFKSDDPIDILFEGGEKYHRDLNVQPSLIPADIET